MRIDLNIPVKGLDGVPISKEEAGENDKLCKFLAHLLAGKPHGINVEKSILWAPVLYQTGVLNVDTVDAKAILGALKHESCTLTHLVAGQIYQVIQKSVEEEERVKLPV